MMKTNLFYILKEEDAEIDVIGVITVRCDLKLFLPPIFIVAADGKKGESEISRD